MTARLRIVFPLLLFVPALLASQDNPVRAMEGTVKTVDTATRTFVVKTADGTEHTLHIADRTAVHGMEGIADDTKDAVHGVKEGAHVVVHYTTKGTEDTAEEIDNTGQGGLKTVDGTLTRIDRSARTMAVKTADGTEETFHLTDRAATDAGKGIGTGAQKSGKVTVYYSEKAGEKVAHFFKRSL